LQQRTEKLFRIVVLFVLLLLVFDDDVEDKGVAVADVVNNRSLRSIVAKTVFFSMTLLGFKFVDDDDDDASIVVVESRLRNFSKIS
jgi:hypothetical protein